MQVALCCCAVHVALILLSSLLHVQVAPCCCCCAVHVALTPSYTWQDRLVRAEIYETRLKPSPPAERARFADAVETTKLQLERAV